MKALIALLGLPAAVLAQAMMQAPTPHADPRWQPPPSAERKHNPLANNPGAEAGGAKLFQQQCAQCHGPKGKGIGDAPDLTRFEVQVESDGALFWKITNGNLDRGMPSFAALPRLERWQLVLHLRRLGK